VQTTLGHSSLTVTSVSGIVLIVASGRRSAIQPLFALVHREVFVPAEVDDGPAVLQALASQVGWTWNVPASETMSAALRLSRAELHRVFREAVHTAVTNNRAGMLAADDIRRALEQVSALQRKDVEPLFGPSR